MKPRATGPTMLANEGATPSQLKMRMRSVPSRAAKPAVRWMASMPMLAPLPHSMADTHSSPKCMAPSRKVDATAHTAPSADSATARCTGRW